MKKKITALVLAALLVLPMFVSTVEAKNLGRLRVAGSDRYATAVEISKSTFKKTSRVILATGSNYADALVGSGLSDAYDAPILLIQKDRIPDVVTNELDRLKPQHIYLLGGNAAIDEQVEVELGRRFVVKRLGGQNRFETATVIADEVSKTRSTANVSIVNGLNFPDALSASAYVAKHNGILLLSDGNTLTDAAHNYAKSASTVHVFGGVNAVSNTLTSTYDATRISGNNRYETSAAIATAVTDKPKYTILADGTNFPDALVAVSLSRYLNDAPIVLVGKDAVDPSVQSYLLKGLHAVIVGGESAVSDWSLNTITRAGATLENETTASFRNVKVLDDYTLQLYETSSASEFEQNPRQVPQIVKLNGISMIEPEGISASELAAYQAESKAYIERLIRGKAVQIRTDAISEGEGTPLVYAYVDGVMINEILLSDGYANVGIERFNAAYNEGFVAHMLDARSDERGLWRHQRTMDGINF